MFYIVETAAQLEKLVELDLNETFISVIGFSDHIHNILNNPSLIYLRPVKSTTGFIVCIDHTESFKLEMKDVVHIINERCEKI